MEEEVTEDRGNRKREENRKCRKGKEEGEGRRGNEMAGR